MAELGPIRFVTRRNAHLRRVPPGSRAFRHPHHIIALHRVEGGQAGLGDERVAVGGAFLALLPAGDDDVNDMVGHDDAWWCAFDGTAVATARGGARVLLHGADRTLPRLHPITGSTARRAASLFLDLRTAVDAGTPAATLTAMARLADLLALWLETAADSSVDDAVSRLRVLIERHACDADLALSSLAEGLGRKPEPLSEAFRERYGRTPIAQRTALRMQRARDLLTEGRMTLAQVAAACGFPDPGYFSRVFRRQTGCTPGAWSHRFTGRA